MASSHRFRIPAGLKGYFSILGTGLHLVQLTGRIPAIPEAAQVRVRVTLNDEDLARVDQIARMHNVSRNAAVVAALQWATRANVLPDGASLAATTADQSQIASGQRRRRSANS